MIIGILQPFRDGVMDRLRKSGPERGKAAADDFPDSSFGRSLSACIGVHLLVSALKPSFCGAASKRLPWG
jgi:hypothetical protein